MYLSLVDGCLYKVYWSFIWFMGACKKLMGACHRVMGDCVGFLDVFRRFLCSL